MYSPIRVTVKTQLVRNPVSPLPLRCVFLLIPLALAWFALSPPVRAVTPPPDGGYPNGNTAEGTDALFNLRSGSANNTAVGFRALYSNTTGHDNTANGGSALNFNTTGKNNTANGAIALYSNTTGDNNTANGFLALGLNTTGSYNTATGRDALYSNDTGFYNTANGSLALRFNRTGHYNTANGSLALRFNTSGMQNTANGVSALYKNTTGVNNTAEGFLALQRNTTGGGNIALGASAGANLTTGNDNIDIGHPGVAGESSTIRIGKTETHTSTFIAGISGVAGTGSQVVVNSNGKLGVAASSARFKDGIKPMDKASEAILALKPVTFRYKHELDPDGVAQFGLVAEQVEKVSPDLVARDERGKAYTVRYEAVNAMLLNEFLKEHRKMQELEKDLRATIEQQQEEFQSAITQQQKEIKALTASLERVSDQLELKKRAPQLAINE